MAWKTVEIILSRLDFVSVCIVHTENGWDSKSVLYRKKKKSRTPLAQNYLRPITIVRNPMRMQWRKDPISNAKPPAIIWHTTKKTETNRMPERSLRRPIRPDELIDKSHPRSLRGKIIILRKYYLPRRPQGGGVHVLGLSH